MKLGIALIPMLVLAGLSAAQERIPTPTPAAAPTITSKELVITRDNQGETFEIPQGDSFLIRLGENPRTGYTWELQPMENQVLVFQSSDYKDDPLGLVGSGGTRTFAFKAQSPGTAAVQLVLKRAWEETPIDRFEVTIRVQSPTPTPVPLSELFGSDSDVITHPYFSEYRPGFEKMLDGYGELLGEYEIERVDRTETYKGVQCIVSYWAGFEDGEIDEYVWVWLAQDKSGNIRLLKEEGWDRWDNQDYSEDFSSNPPIEIPADLRVGTLIWLDPEETEVVAELGATVPRNEHGLGPYENCLVILETVQEERGTTIE